MLGVPCEEAQTTEKLLGVTFTTDTLVMTSGGAAAKPFPGTNVNAANTVAPMKTAPVHKFGRSFAELIRILFESLRRWWV
jgi:hypothetical protein